MAERSNRDARAADKAAQQYIRVAAGPHSPADEIAKAKSLLDAGTIAPQEYESLKARAIK